jgi:serine/threonine protein kinase
LLVLLSLWISKMLDYYPILLGLCILSCAFDLTSGAQCIGPLSDTAFDGLQIIYNETYGEVWSFQSEESSWSFDSRDLWAPCRDLWQGITCEADNKTTDSNCSIIYMELQSLGLTGSLPSAAFNPFNSSLQTLNLANNSLNGRFPSIGVLSELTVLIGSNAGPKGFSGPIPSDIIKLTKLVHLDLSENVFAGTFPLFNTSSEFPFLQYLNFAANEITGTVPQSLQLQFPALTNISAGQNYLSGTLAPNFVSASINLWSVRLNNNELEGAFPDLTGSASLTILEFGHNSFTGQLLGIPSAAEYFDLTNNQLSGYLPVIPTSLNTFCVGKNLFSGELNMTNFDFPTLKILDVSGNRFSGSLAYVPGNIKRIYLYENTFVEQIPNISKGLEIFEANSNNFTGSLPAVFWDEDFIRTSKLTIVHLHDNPALEGTIPSTIGSLSLLTRFNALGGNFSCYEPIYPQTAYFDYCTEFTMMIPSRVPSYPVCQSIQTTDLCSMESSLGINNRMSSDLVFEAETAEGSVDKSVVSRQASPYFEVDFADPTDTFEYFEVSFSGSFLGAYQNIIVAIACSDSPYPYIGASVYEFEGIELPGVNGKAPFVCKKLYLGVEILNRATLDDVLETYGYYHDVEAYYYDPHAGLKDDADDAAKSGALSYKVSRFSRKRMWDCAESQNYTTNPCEWFGKCCVFILTGSHYNLYLGVGCLQNTAVSSISLGGVLAPSDDDGSYQLAEIQFPFYLSSIDLSNNYLVGTIPESLLELKTMLKELDLSFNQLTGSLDVLYEITGLETLNLNGNRFAGTLSSSLAYLSNISSLKLESNKLVGSFPKELCELAADATVLVDGNYFDCDPSCGINFGACRSASRGSNALSAGSVAAIIIGTIVVLGGSFWTMRRFCQEHEYRELPLHLMIIRGQKIKIEHAERHENTLNLTNGEGQRLLDIFYRYDRPSLIALEALTFIVDASVKSLLDVENPVNGKSNTNMSPDLAAGYAWGLIVQKKDLLSLHVVKQILGKYEAHVHTLAFSKDMSGRRYMEAASSLARDEIQKALFLDRRYDLQPGPAAHKSATSQVVFAKDHGEELSLKEPVAVALKFMKNRHQFLAEVEIRAQMKFDPAFVISTYASFDALSTEPSSMRFLKATQRRGFGDYPFCVIMGRADINLQRVIDERHIAGEDWDQIRLILRTLCNCLVHLHSKGVVHGDLKPTNLVLVDGSVCLIDLDASTRFGVDTVEFAAAKYSSGFLPPELFACWDEEVLVRTYSADDDGRVVHDGRYELVAASPVLDMWAVGVILFQLCTGFPLLYMNVDGNVDRRGARLIHDWAVAPSYRNEKLAAIEDKYARNLVSLLLSSEPSKRPDALRVLSHPFLTGQTPSRMVGEDPEFDVFISYRVASDSHLAQHFYECLQRLELRVWLDKFCLEPGQPWEEGFCRGLVSSSCFVCLISKDAINNNNSANCNFPTLTPASACDNVLLEWRLALELRARNMIEGIFPVFVGPADKADSGFSYQDYFLSGCHPKSIPDITVASVEAKLAMHLDRQGLGLPYETSVTVASVAKQICAHQGAILKGNGEIAHSQACEAIVAMRNATRESREKSKLAKSAKLQGTMRQVMTNSTRDDSTSVGAADECQPPHRAGSSAKVSSHEKQSQPQIFLQSRGRRIAPEECFLSL